MTEEIEISEELSESPPTLNETGPPTLDEASPPALDEMGPPPIDEAGHEIIEIIRKQSGDALGAICGLEEITEEITDVLSEKICIFTQEEMELKFLEMELFSGSSFLGVEDDNALVPVRINGDQDELLACMLIKPDVVRYLISLTLGSSKKSGNQSSGSELRASEQALLVLFVDHLVSGFFSEVDALESMGIPREPFVTTKQELFQASEKRELVSLTFEMTLDEQERSFDVIVPLAIFGGEGEDLAEQKDTSTNEKRIWKNKLFDQIEQVAIPMSVELATVNMPILDIGLLEVGAKFDLNIEAKDARVVDDTGALVFRADLAVSKQEFSLHVTGVGSEGGG